VCCIIYLLTFVTFANGIGQHRPLADPPYIPRLKVVGFTALSIIIKLVHGQLLYYLCPSSENLP
ncbi:MAG: hypothetical protein AB1589_17155, partial [Cyanobacteriota bacterium]